MHITNRVLGLIAEDIAKGVLIDTAIDRATDIAVKDDSILDLITQAQSNHPSSARSFPSILLGAVLEKDIREQSPGWEHDLGLVGRFTQLISQAFQDAASKSSQLRNDTA